MSSSADIVSLAVAFPKYVRGNDWWRRRAPEMVAAAEAKSLSKLWQPPPPGSPGQLFAEAMEPYLNDPFRGTRDRRVLGPGESALTLEVRAAKAALAAAHMSASDVELALVTSLLPDPVGIGDAVFFAREMGLRGACWNLETACSGALVGLQTAEAFVKSGKYRNVLLVVCCTYSRNMDEGDTLSWLSGDGAAAFVVGPAQSGQGILGSAAIHTADTIDSLFIELQPPPNDGRPFRLRATKKAGALLRDTAEGALRRCAQGALHEAGLAVKDVDFLVTATPNAWYPAFAAKVLGIEPARTINMHETYCNIGPVLMPANLYHAALERCIKPGDVVLLYTIGSVSSAGAMVVRWGDVKLGPAPEPGVPEP